MSAHSLFIGAQPAGLVYCDRGVEEHGDYARVAFLPYESLVLEWDRPASPLRAEIIAHAATIQAQRGQLMATSASATRRADGSLVGDGQTVRLGAA